MLIATVLGFESWNYDGNDAIRRKQDSTFTTMLSWRDSFYSLLQQGKMSDYF